VEIGRPANKVCTKFGESFPIIVVTVHFVSLFNLAQITLCLADGNGVKPYLVIAIRPQAFVSLRDDANAAFSILRRL